MKRWLNLKIIGEKYFLATLFDKRFVHLKTEIGFLLATYPKPFKGNQGIPRTLSTNIFSPAEDLPGIEEDRVRSLLTCIRKQYVKYKGARNSYHNSIQDMFRVLRKDFISTCHKNDTSKSLYIQGK